MINLPRELFENDSDTDLVEGLNFYDDGEWEKSLSLLELAANKGNVTAIFKLANSLSNLDREDEALPLWEVAADWGHFGACNNFAIRLNNVGDTEGARALYMRSAQAGNPQAMFNLALTYDEESQSDHYREWLSKAGQEGMLRAQAMLGDHLYRHGLEEEGLKLLDEAMSKGSLSAHILAGKLAIQNEDYQRAYLLSDNALALPLIDDDKHLVKNAFMIRGVSGDHLGYLNQAINDVKIAKEMGFDVSIAPLHLRVPDMQSRIPAPNSSQAAHHYSTLAK